MNRTSLILTALLMLSITVMMAPGILALNRGKILQHIAMWLAIFLALALVYKNFGPDSPHPLFHLPYGIERQAIPAENPDRYRG